MVPTGFPCLYYKMASCFIRDTAIPLCFLAQWTKLEIFINIFQMHRLLSGVLWVFYYKVLWFQGMLPFNMSLGFTLGTGIFSIFCFSIMPCHMKKSLWLWDGALRSLHQRFPIASKWASFLITSKWHNLPSTIKSWLENSVLHLRLHQRSA